MLSLPSLRNGYKISCYSFPFLLESIYLMLVHLACIDSKGMVFLFFIRSISTTQTKGMALISITFLEGFIYSLVLR